MPAVNQRQRRLFGMVRAAQKGETPASPQVAKIASSISAADAKKFAKTKEKNLPESAVPGKPAEKVGALTNIDIPQDEREAAKQRTLAKAKAAREKRMNTEETGLDEGMSLKDFKANRRKLKRKEASDDAKKRGHVGKEWYNSGRTYSPDEAKSGRANMPDHERQTRHRSAVDPDNDNDDMYSADKTKNPKKLRKQKAMGEIKKEGYLPEEEYDRMKDRRMERGGVDGNTRYPSKPSAGKSETAAEKKAREDKHREASKKALDMVRQSITAKYGKGALMNSFDAQGETIQEDEYRKLMAQERKAEKDREANRAGRKSISPGKLAASTGRDYADSNIKFHAKVTGKKTTTEEVVSEAGDYWHPDPEKDKRISGAGNKMRAREDQAASAKPKEDPKKLKPGESYMDYAKRQRAASSTPTTTAANKETFGDKIKRKLGNAVDRVAGIKKEGTISYKDFIAEGNRTGRMMQKSKTQVTGHISADRGDDEKANREKRKGLEKDLKKHGIGHKKGVGEYKYGSGETGREVSYQTSKPEKMSKRRFGKVMRRLGRKHGQESVITKDADKSAKLHYTEKGSKAKSDSIGKTKAGKHPEGYGETSGTKVRSGKLPKKTTKGAYHYG
jgi:hypothetical protein